MRPKQQQKARHDDLFRARLDQIINMKHALVALADQIDWAWLDEQLADSFSDQGRQGDPGTARARLALDHPTLHRGGRGGIARRLRTRPSEGARLVSQV